MENNLISKQNVHKPKRREENFKVQKNTHTHTHHGHGTHSFVSKFSNLCYVHIYILFSPKIDGERERKTKTKRNVKIIFQIVVLCTWKFESKIINYTNTKIYIYK